MKKTFENFTKKTPPPPWHSVDLINSSCCFFSRVSLSQYLSFSLFRVCVISAYLYSASLLWNTRFFFIPIIWFSLPFSSQFSTISFISILIFFFSFVSLAFRWNPMTRRSFRMPPSLPHPKKKTNERNWMKELEKGPVFNLFYLILWRKKWKKSYRPRTPWVRRS